MTDETLTIVFEDRWLVGINKPSGMHSVHQAGGGEGSVANWLAGERAYMAKASPKAGDAGLLNRLDFMTSGLLLAAKDREAWLAFNALQKAGQIRKTYVCLLDGLLPGAARVEAYVGARYRHSKKVDVRKTAGKRFLQSWVDLKPLSANERLSLSLAQAAIGTGRRHQIRALSGFIGHPLLGDAMYGSKRALPATLEQYLPSACGVLPDFFLHAEAVELYHPFVSRSLSITAPCPDWFYSLGSIF